MIRAARHGSTTRGDLRPRIRALNAVVAATSRRVVLWALALLGASALAARVLARNRDDLAAVAMLGLLLGALAATLFVVLA